VKQFSIKELSQSPSKVIAQAPCEIVNRGEVVAVIEKRRKVSMPDFLGRLRRMAGRPETWPKVDWDKEMGA
jgi:hypothetical protein